MDIGAQKIDRSSLVTYGMVIAGFQVLDKLSRTCFFQEIFLLTNTSINIILGISFLTFNNVDVMFAN